RIHAHLQALGGDLVTETGADLGLGLGMQGQLQAERGAGRLAGAIVRRGADAAEAEHHVASGEGLAQGFGQVGEVVAGVTRPRQLEATRAEQFDELGQVFVAATSGQDLIADDQGTEVHESFRWAAPASASSTVTPYLSRWRRRVSSM